MMRWALALAALVGVAPAVHAESLELLGYAGILGEWELSAPLTLKGAGDTKDFSGPLTMRHVGICTQDGPEEKTGEIKVSLTGKSRMMATLLVDGVECSYSGRQSESYTGSLKCPDRRAVPLMVWLKQKD
jgi:hypothetical protein